MAVPQVLTGVRASAGLRHGFDKIAELLAVTLGPTQGTVLSQHATHAEPEVLGDAATIARRVLALPDRAEDVGAMLARNLVWRMHLRAGDGCATAAVLARAILDQGYRYIAAGGDPTSLRRGLDRAARAAVAALGSMARPVRSDQDLAKLAETVTTDPNLSAILGEIYGRLGADAYITIEDYVSPYLERQYYEGGRWVGRIASPYLTDPTTRRAVLTECHVALCAGAVTSVEDVERLLQVVTATEWHQVALIAKEISGPALATLVLNHQKGSVKVLAAELREHESARDADLQDLAAMTAATVLSVETGRPLSTLQPSDLGAAPRVEADAEELIVVGGEGRPEDVQRQGAALRARLQESSEQSDEADRLRFRLARLSGQIVKLMIGAHTEAGRQFTRQKAEKAIRALPAACREGVVPGGGIAYVNCIPAVLAVPARGNEVFGVKTLAFALETPFRRILRNAGVADPGARLAEAQHCGPDFGYDVLTERIVSMPAAGILDPAGVLREALQTAVSGAVMALTTDTLVLKRHPETSVEP